MRALRRVPLVLTGLLLAVAAGCTTSSGTAAGPTATPTPTPTQPPCPAGTWTSTGVAASASAAGVTLTLSGGSGVKVTIGPDGKVMADFSGMEPATFSTQLGTTPVTGTIAYQGTTDGTVDLTATSSPTASPLTTPASTGSGKSGPWTPTGSVNVSALQVSVKLTQPIASTLIDNVKVSDVTGAQTAQAGNAIDLQPLLRPGTYQCQSEKTLVITTSGAAPVLTWTLSRS